MLELEYYFLYSIDVHILVTLCRGVIVIQFDEHALFSVALVYRNVFCYILIAQVSLLMSVVSQELAVVASISTGTYKSLL